MTLIPQIVAIIGRLVTPKIGRFLLALAANIFLGCDGQNTFELAARRRHT
jgi:hypothetical protein